MTDEPGDGERAGADDRRDGADEPGDGDGPQTLPIEHDLPPDLRDALADDTASLAGLYNDLQDLSPSAFADRFGGALATLRSAAVGAEPVVCVLGVELAPGDDPVQGGAIASVHVPGSDGGVGEALYVAETAPTDEFLMLPIRPADCPPGSGEPASELSVDAFQEIVSAMTYTRFDLLQNDLSTYRDAYLRPLVCGVQLYADGRDAGTGADTDAGTGT